ncbi:hypothetical protein K470DRAFT_63035 [Piedraia hortae CBS 480.64]|uniref:Uncharacterized protein n=1 Tax=Piedraia hortae CBS 480.64 TaxID=1314780 RepID=A0A6A7C0R5_9PEZI|nr:hypothetical protein K470DRAFT_63035 [Piedraia hortae CBS 480.64]
MNRVLSRVMSSALKRKRVALESLDVNSLSNHENFDVRGCGKDGKPTIPPPTKAFNVHNRVSPSKSLGLYRNGLSPSRQIGMSNGHISPSKAIGLSRFSEPRTSLQADTAEIFLGRENKRRKVEDVLPPTTTPQVEPPTEEKSFSSLIDYDPVSSQSRTELLQQSNTGKGQHSQHSQPPRDAGSTETPTQQKSSDEQPKTKFVDAKRKLSHAEILQLRLSVAMYKVRTDQIGIPFGNLQVRRPSVFSERVRGALREAGRVIGSA